MPRIARGPVRVAALLASQPVRVPLAVLWLCFFGSGGVALGLEAAWFRRMAPLFGASHAVTGALLAVFMTGLALGGALGAALAPRLRRPLRAYALCETLVALGAWASGPLFTAIDRSATTASVATSVLLAWLVLAVPTAAMGATTPLLVASARDVDARFRRTLALLYAANLAGAAAGAWATGFVLLPRAGVAAVTHGWSLAGLCVAALALAADRFGSGAPGAPADLAPEVSLPARTERLAAVGMGLVLGFLSFTLQVALGRVAALLLGSTAYTFELLAATLLLALALGGGAARHEESPRETWSRVSARALRISVAVFLGMLVVRVVPVYTQISLRRGVHPGVLRWTELLVVAAWPAYEIGAIFPALATRMRVRHPGRSAGLASWVATVGNVAGALVAGFWLIPHVGLQSTLRTVCALALAVAVTAAFLSDRIRAASTTVAALLALLVATALDRPWDAVALSAGTYRTVLNRRLAERDAVPCGPGRRLRSTRVLSQADGVLGAVTVLAHSDGDRCTLYGMRVNGKTEGSVFVAAPIDPVHGAAGQRSSWLDVGDLPSERAVGALALPSDGRVARALVVGWGTGISTQTLLSRTSGTVLATEIEPRVVDAAHWFTPELPAHPRIREVLDDARRVLRALPDASLDAIVSHPSNPWVTGATTLFSDEFFAIARGKLRRGGTMVAWVQLYEIDLEAVQSLVHTFVNAFPGAYALRTAPASSDLFLVGARESAATPPWTDIVTAFPHARVAEGPALRAWASRAPRVTDDNALLEFRVADMMLDGREDPRAPRLEGLALSAAPGTVAVDRP